MIKMADMPIHVKKTSKISRTIGPNSMKLGMQHLGLQPIIICSTYDHRVTLTYFIAKSKTHCPKVKVTLPQKVSPHIHLMLLYFQSSGVVCNLLSFSCPLTPFHLDTVLRVLNRLTFASRCINILTFLSVDLY